MHSQDVGPAVVRKGYLAFAAASTRLYPHGSRTGCRACHLTAEPLGPTFVEDNPSKRCTRCHTGDHARIHTVDAAPNDDTYPMAFLSYPLDADGKLSCSTCHDHVCRGKSDPANPAFLRGGPYGSTADFCYKCHPRAGLGGLNPHDQVDPKGNVVESVCTFCHKTPPSGDAYDPDELLYVRSSVELCTRCHDQGPHPSVNHLVEMSEKKQGKLRDYEQRHKVILPLDPQGRIVCATCHNPHDKGVLHGEAALGAGERHKLRVPSFAELCTPCHQRYD